MSNRLSGILLEEEKPTFRTTGTNRLAGLAAGEKSINRLAGLIKEPEVIPTEPTKDAILQELPTVGIGLGPMVDELGDTRTMRERLGYPRKEPIKTGIPEIGKAIRELVAPTTPYMEKEAIKAYKEIPRTLENAGMRVLTLGGLAGPLMGLKPSELRAALDEDIREQAGFAPALAPALGETTLLAVEWGYLYPKLFAAVGATGSQIAKIPKVAKGTKALKSLGGIEKVASKYPRTFNTATKGLVAFTKGSTVGTIISAPEALGEELPAGEALKHISKSAALLGGVAAGFQLASTADTAIYVKRLRGALIKASNQRFTAKISEIKTAIPQGAGRTAALKSLESFKRIELQSIDGIVSAAEAHLIGLKHGKMYQAGQEMVETPQKAAERFIRMGYLTSRPYPKGEPTLKKGLGKPEPFIKMPTTRVGEAKEAIVEAMKIAKHPVKAAERIAARKPPTVGVPAIPKGVTPPPIKAIPSEIAGMTNDELYERFRATKITEPEWKSLYEEVVRRKAAEVPPTEPKRTIAEIEEEIPGVEVETKPGQAKSIESIKKEGQQEPDVLIVKPSAKPRRVIVSAKGKKKTVISVDDKTELYKFTDFGGGIGVKGKNVINVKAQRPLMELPSAAEARKAATTLKEAGFDLSQPPEEIQKQFQEWLKENNVENTKESIIDFLTGRGKELEPEDYIKQFDVAALKGIDYSLEKAVNAIRLRLKDFVSEVPEFALNPTFTFDKESGQLVFKDRYRFSIYPNYFGLNAENLKDGQTIRFDLDSFNIKQPSAKKLKTAEPFLGEPKILGRTLEKPIPIERMGKPKKPRELTAEEKTYERALTDIETGVEVEVEGGITYQTIREGDIRRVAELGRKAGRQAWTVERDILFRQERGTSEVPVDISKAIEIIRGVFSAAEPSGQAKTEPAKAKEPQQLYDELIAKWGDDAVTEAQEFLSDEDDTYQEIDAKFFDLDSEGKGGTEQAKALERQLLKMVGDYLSAKPTPEVGAKQFEILNSRGQRYGGLFESREKAQKYLEKRITSAAGRIQFTIQEVKAKEPQQLNRLAGLMEEPSEFIPEAAEPKHIKNVVVDTFREWPKGIRKVGKDYWTEVMAVAKQLATPYRYKALRQTMLGVFRHKKRPVPEVVGIEVQDVTDALTATHELGHNIDWLLNNKTFPSSIKARFPNTTVGEMTLRKELKKISQVLRPDMWEERPKAYIKKHTELMADYISHYILDPEKTKGLAPNLTRAFEAKLATRPELFDTISRLQESRYTGPEEPPIAKHIREVFPLPKEFTPLKLAIDMADEGYVKAAEELGITAARHYKLLIQRAQREADRIDELVPSKNRQTDLVVVAEKGSANPWTGKTFQEIVAEGLTDKDRRAISLFRAYQEKARQTVNKYLRSADIAEYISFINDYFIHAYHTPLTEKYKSAISRWAKKSPQAKKRVLPDLAKAVEIGLKPRAKTLSEGLMLWAGINYRVMTNKAFLRILPNITNDDGVSILQKPQDYPNWPTVDYWPIRQNYAVPLPGRGILLFQGRVAIDPKVKPFIDAMFGRKVFNTPVRIIEGLNATWKAFELTLFSLFHHQAEFFSACGALGPRALPFVGGYYGKRAQVFGKKPKLWGFLPAHIATLKAGKQLEKCPEFMDDYLAHGGQRGYISTEGINLMERMLKQAADYLENIIQYKPTTPLTGVFAAAYVPVKTAQAAYSFHQHLLWDNVNRAKLVSYYQIVADGAKNSNLPIKDVKEIAVKYINENFGGLEFLNTIFRKPKTRQFFTQLMMSLDWTYAQIKTARWPFGIGEKGAARRAFVRKRGREHWFWYLAAISSFAIAGSYAMSGKGPWDNEKGHNLDVDWTKIWRKLDEDWAEATGRPDWKQRADYSRRYIGLGKAGRELVRWVTSPLRAFGYKLSPVARSMFEQSTGFNIGSSWAEPWAKEDLQLHQEVYARFKHLMENFVPFAFSGNNAFLAFPSRKGMTRWKAVRAYEQIYEAKARKAAGGIGGAVTKIVQILAKDEEKLKVQIAEACRLNNVDVEKADRAALSGVRSKYYSMFWTATKKPEKTAIQECNAYAKALLELGVRPRGFKQSMRYRYETLPERARVIGIEAIQKVAAER